MATDRYVIRCLLTQTEQEPTKRVEGHSIGIAIGASDTSQQSGRSEKISGKAVSFRFYTAVGIFIHDLPRMQLIKMPAEIMAKFVS